jgi:hypothetical protein
MLEMCTAPFIHGLGGAANLDVWAAGCIGGLAIPHIPSKLDSFEVPTAGCVEGLAIPHLSSKLASPDES